MCCAPVREARPRTPRRLALAGLIAWSAVAGAASELPDRFGDIVIGAPWSAIEPAIEATALDHLTTAWDHHAHACGYRTVRVRTGAGQLLITAYDFVVTRLGYSTPIEKGADVRAVADLVIRTYGRPSRAEMRDDFGQPTIGPVVNAVILDYEGVHPVRFTVTGAELWQYTTTIEYKDRRWHENRTLRCTREREKAAQSAANG